MIFASSGHDAHHEFQRQRSHVGIYFANGRPFGINAPGGRLNSTDGAWDIYKDGINVRNGVNGIQVTSGYVLTNNTFTLGARSVV